MARYLLIQASACKIPLADRSVHCVVTSPPYYGLRDYGVSGQIGLETTPDAYVARIVDVFREVRRVLRDDGTLWLNIGDSYGSGDYGVMRGAANRPCHAARSVNSSKVKLTTGLKPKDLVGIPWLLAFALRADGWYLRSEIIWSKSNPMPESVHDRPSKAHEQLFLLAKSPTYFYDAEAIREPNTQGTIDRMKSGPIQAIADNPKRQGSLPDRRKGGYVDADGRNTRSVWTIATNPFKGAHFATMPVKLAARCIKAGTSKRGCCPRCGAPWRRLTKKHRVATRPGHNTKVNDHSGKVIGNRDPQRHVTETRTVGWEPGCQCPVADPVPCRVFDPFGGAGTTIVAAEALGRIGIATELNPKYLAIARRRIERPHARVARPARAGAPMPLLDGLDDET